MDHCEISRWQIIKNTLQNLSYEDFFSQASKDENGIILDVRTPEEFNFNSVTDAINLNYLSHQLADDLEQLEKDKTYYVYCQTGRRSLRVCVLLKNSGFSVINLDAGLASKDKKAKNINK